MADRDGMKVDRKGANTPQESKPSGGTSGHREGGQGRAYKAPSKRGSSGGKPGGKRNS